jgi:hypothetical protein
MKTPRRWTIAALLASGLMMACGGSGTANPAPADAGPTADLGPTPDASRADAPRVDAPRADAPGDRPVSTVDPCTGARDLSGMTPGADGAIHVTGDNSAAPGVGLGTLPMACVTGGAKGGVVVFQYTMRTSALLRVSTDNAGTAADLDSVVAVLPTCARAAAPLACNDDAASGNLHSTATTAATVAAGTHVFVVVGGFGMDATMASTGAFELTVREVTPVASGQACTDADVCAAGSHCLASPTAPAARVCVPDGTTGGACTAGATCAAGLACAGTGVCRAPLAANATCLPTDACATGTHCAAVNPDGSLRRCLADGGAGAACRVTGAACDASLACSATMPTATAPGVCRAMVAVGAACDPAHACPTGAHCLSGAADPTMVTCQADGALGTLCRRTATPCDAGLACSAADPTMQTGICQTVVMGAGACDLQGRTSTCAGTSECAPNASFTAGTCAAPGTAAGVSCRTAGAACDAGLTCSEMTPSADAPGVCQRVVAAGAACDYQFGATACMGAAVCAPSSVAAGTCAAARVEAEPNNTPAAPQAAITASTVFQAAITPNTDVDCFAVSVPANGSLFLLTSDGHDGCPAMADTLLTLYTAAGVALGTNDDGAALCSLLDGTRAGPAHRLAAGTYVACVSAYGGARGPAAIAQYFLTVGVVAAP